MTPASAGGEQQACISGGKERMELTLEQLPEIKGEKEQTEVHRYRDRI